MAFEHPRAVFGLACLAASLGFASGALAQTPATPPAPPAPDQHSETVAEQPPTPPPAPLSWDIAVGGVFTTGNTESLTTNVASHFHYFALPHSVEADVAYVLGLSGDGYGTKNAESLNFHARYDYYLDVMNALFVATRLRYDPFAGLAPRVQGQVGYMRNFIREADGKNRFWGEIGYDLTVDAFTYERLVGPGTKCNDTDRPCGEVTHSLRLFLGYDNEVSDAVNFRTGVEVLLNVDPGTIARTPDVVDPTTMMVTKQGRDISGLEDVRVNWDTTLKLHLVGNLQAELKLLLLFDNVPVGIETDHPADKLDTTTQLNLVYTLL